jgi:hypothetical protein
LHFGTTVVDALQLDLVDAENGIIVAIEPTTVRRGRSLFRAVVTLRARRSSLSRPPAGDRQ